MNNKKEVRTFNMEFKHDDYGEVEGQDSVIASIRQLIRGEIAEYTKLTPWKSYAALAMDWLIVALTITTVVITNHWLAWVIAFPIIASRQHAIGVIAHEAAHYRLSSNRAINDFVGDFFGFLPLLLCLKRWRVSHLIHHKYVMTDKDPAVYDFNRFACWKWPRSYRSAILLTLQDFFGFNIPVNIETAKQWAPFSNYPVKLEKADKWRVGIFYILLIAALSWFNGWLLFIGLWLLPYMTLTAWLMRIRTIAEHIAIPDKPEGLESTRHVDGNWLERQTFAPHGINYHIVHHAFPAVPFYNLPKLHERLIQDDRYREQMVHKKSYFGRTLESVWSEITAAA